MKLYSWQLINNFEIIQIRYSDFYNKTDIIHFIILFCLSNVENILWHDSLLLCCRNVLLFWNPCSKHYSIDINGMVTCSSLLLSEPIWHRYMYLKWNAHKLSVKLFMKRILIPVVILKIDLSKTYHKIDSHVHPHPKQKQTKSPAVTTIIYLAFSEMGITNWFHSLPMPYHLYKGIHNMISTIM